MGGGGGEVDVVVTGTCANHNFQLGSCGKNLFVDFVAADDEGVDILHGVEKLLLRGVFFQKSQFIASFVGDFADAVDGNFGKRLFGCYKYFHDAD